MISLESRQTGAVRHDGDPPSLHSRGGAGEELRCLEKFDHAVDANKTNPAEQGVMNEVGREAPQPKAEWGRLMPASLEHDHGLDASGAARGGGKNAWAFDAVEVEQDGPRAHVLRQNVQQVRQADIKARPDR